MLKSWRTEPVFLKTNVTFPGLAADFVESLKKNSPPLTWTVVAFTAVGRSTCAEASWTSASEAIAIAARTLMVSLFIATSPCDGGCLWERVGDQLELRLLEEAGRPGPDEQRVAVDRREGVDAGRCLGSPER